MEEQKIRRDRYMGMNLRRLRMNAGLSQEKLCAELQLRGCDIGRTTYAKYESGELNIRASVIIELRKFYNCSYDEFFSDEQEKITETALRPFYRQSKYYSPGYNKQTNNSFIHFVDALTKAITTQQTLSVNEEQELQHPSFTTYQRLAEKISTFQNSLKE